jgi:hypothetical protein
MRIEDDGEPVDLDQRRAAFAAHTEFWIVGIEEKP